MNACLVRGLGFLRAGSVCALLAGCVPENASNAKPREVGHGTSAETTSAAEPTPAPVGEGEDSASVASVQQAATATTPVVFVVRTGGTDGYCDDVLYSGRHAEAIQACIDKANMAGGGTVLLLAGTYSTGTWPLTLKSNVTLAGAGFRGAKLAPATTSTDIIGTVQDYTAIQDLTFDATKISSGGAAVRFRGSVVRRNVRIDGNLFISDAATANSTYHGVHADGNSLEQIAIRNNRYQATAGTGGTHVPFYVRVVTAQNLMNEIRVEGNDVQLAGAATKGAFTFEASGTTQSRGIVLSNNSLFAAGASSIGVKFAGNYQAQISGNSLRAETAVSAVPTPTGVCNLSVTGNRFFGGKLSLQGACAVGSVVTANSDSLADSPLNIAGTGRPAVLVRAYRLGDVSFTAGTPTVVPFNRVNVDHGSNYQLAENAFVAPIGGIYRVRACVRFSGENFAEGDVADVELTVGEATQAFNRVHAFGSDFHSCVADVVSMNGLSKLQVKVTATGAPNGRKMLGNGSYSTFLTVERVSDN